MPLNDQGIGTITVNGRTYDIRPHAQLEGADLRGANLSEANLSGADLMEARLERANLSGANLSGANLMEARLERADLRGSLLMGARLIGANLEGALLMGARLMVANLTGVNLRQANLEGAGLTGVILRESHLERANLEGATLTGADLRGAHLEGTIMPNGQAYRPPRVLPPPPPQVQPPPPPQAQPPQPPQPQGRAYEIHNAFARLNIDQFMSIIENHTLITNDNNGPILTRLIQYVQTQSIPEEEKQHMVNGLTTIQNAIIPTLNDPTNQALKNKVKKVITYVLEQPAEFIDLYLKNYTFDCLNAYNPGDRSCVKGMIERIVMIIRDVVVTICSKENSPLCKPEYTELKNTFYPEIDINHLFQEWFNANSEKDEIVNLDPTQRKEHFISFVRGQITPEEYNHIQEKLTSYIEQNNAIFETLTFGGKKKRKNKTEKKQKQKNRTKTKKNKRKKSTKRKSKQMKKTKQTKK